MLVHDTHDGCLGSHCNMVAYSQFSLMTRNKPKAFFKNRVALCRGWPGFAPKSREHEL